MRCLKMRSPIPVEVTITEDLKPMCPNGDCCHHAHGYAYVKGIRFTQKVCCQCGDVLLVNPYDDEDEDSCEDEDTDANWNDPPEEDVDQ